VYDTEWLRRGLDLSPISLPFSDVAFNGAKGINGLPGLIADFGGRFKSGGQDRMARS